MNLESLRIGSYVMTNYRTDIYSVVESVSKELIEVKFLKKVGEYVGCGCRPEDIIPIKLTKEVLVELGFTESDTTKGAFEDKKNNKLIENCGGCWHFIGTLNNITVCYLHELQNIYMDVCGSTLLLTKKETNV
jgi:hypothetical protein